MTTNDGDLIEFDPNAPWHPEPNIINEMGSLMDSALRTLPAIVKLTSDEVLQNPLELQDEGEPAIILSKEDNSKRGAILHLHFPGPFLFDFFNVAPELVTEARLTLVEGYAGFKSIITFMRIGDTHYECSVSLINDTKNPIFLKKQSSLIDTQQKYVHVEFEHGDLIYLWGLLDFQCRMLKELAFRSHNSFSENTPPLSSNE